MKHHTFLGFVGSAITALLFVSSRAAAASSATEYSSIYAEGGLFESTQTVTYDGPKMREEMTSRSRVFLFGRSKDAQITIVRADLGKRWMLDPKRKRYTEEDLRQPEEKIPEPSAKTEEPRPEPETASKENDIRIKTIETKVDGPGAPVTLHGFVCRPYVVKTITVFESVKDKKEVGSHTYYQKSWNTLDSSALEQYEKDEVAFYKAESEAVFGGKARMNRIMEQFKAMVAQSQASSETSPGKRSDLDWSRMYMEQAKAMEKIKGHPVRTWLTWSMQEFGQKSGPTAPPPPALEPQDDLIQPGDVTNGVSGLMSGMASRWASKKVEKKIVQKAAEHPTWVDEMKADLGITLLPFAQMIEKTQLGQTASDDALFEVPAGYKKVNSF